MLYRAIVRYSVTCSSVWLIMIQQPQQVQKPAAGKGGNSGNTWDIVGDFANLDNIALEKKKQDDGKVKKKEKTMSDMASKRPSVSMGAHIDGFAPSNAAPAAGGNPFAASPYMGGGGAPGGYGAAPGYGGAPGGYGAAPGYGAMPGYGAPYGGAPPPAYGMQAPGMYAPNMGYPNPGAAPRRGNGF